MSKIINKKVAWNGAKLKEKREKVGKTQSAMAEFLQIAPQSYGEMERNEIKPDSTNLAKLCIFFDCPAQDFFSIPENFLQNI